MLTVATQKLGAAGEAAGARDLITVDIGGTSCDIALIEAGVLVGLPRPTSQQLAVQTLLGSAKLLAETCKVMVRQPGAGDIQDASRRDGGNIPQAGGLVC